MSLRLDSTPKIQVVLPPPDKAIRIGVISDTHNFLDPKVLQIFSGVDHILHGGDIGLPAILQALERIAPVTAVLGNTDDLAFGYRLTESVDLAGLKVLVHHIVNPYAVPDCLRSQIRGAEPDLVVFGHTHKPFCATVGGILFFNPGYAGKQRFNLERTVAILECNAGKISHRYFPLD